MPVSVGQRHAPAPTPEVQQAAPVPIEVGRRSVLKGIGLAGVTILVAGSGAVSYRSYDNGVLDAGSGTPYEAWGQWRSDPSPVGAVAAAILAANPHNTQPWSFRVTDQHIDVFSDPSRQMASMDSLGREHHIGLGCAVENLALALDARGHHPTVQFLPDPNDPRFVGRVAFVAGPAATSRLYDAIGSRHSDRGPYTRQVVPAATLAALAGQVTDLPGVAVRWVTDEPTKAALGALLIEATRAIIADAQQSSEAFAWFRNTRDDINRYRDGLTLDGQGLSPMVLTLAKLLPTSSRAAGDAFWLTQTRTVHTATAAAYGIVTVADPANPAQRLAGGRLLQRIHLAATDLGLGLQHMNQITERIDREQARGAAATFGPRFDEVLAQAGRHGLATFRLGHSERKARRSPRRSLKAVLR